MAEKKLNLLADFPATSKEEWMEKVTKDLKGKDFDKKLVWKTNEGFKVQPCYRREDIADFNSLNSAPGKFPYVRGTKQDNDWYVRQNMNVTDAKLANKKALDILYKGVTSLGLNVDSKLVNAESVATLLNGICADAVELNFSVCSKHIAELTTLVINYFKANNVDLKTVKGSFACDPMEAMLTKGISSTREEMSALLKEAVVAGRELPNYRTVSVNAFYMNNSGAYCAQEMGYALAWGNQYMEMLTEAGISADEAAQAIKFNIGIGANYFMEIAKFRAQRELWAKIVKAYGASDEAAKIEVYAQTSMFNKTVFDAHVNLLRTQTEAMSAALAGVNSMTVNPFDTTYKASDDFSERIARNQQLLLKEEVYFDKVTDISAGSYYIETLTENVAEQAWNLFLEITKNGGFLANVANEKIQKDVEANLTKRLKLVAQRREVFLGSTDFPNFGEFAAEKLNEPSSIYYANHDEKGAIKTLPIARATQEFEAVRLAVEKAAHRPKAFMLTIGHLNMRLARAQYACNYLATAGYDVVDNLGFDTVEAGFKAAREAGADIVVLCSSDDEYAEFGPQAQKLADKELVVVAGAPACMDDLKAAGIEFFIHVRTNVLETLRTLNDKLLK